MIKQGLAAMLLTIFGFGMMTPTVALACEGGGEEGEGPGGVLSPKTQPLDFGEVEIGQSKTLSDTFEELFTEVAIKEVEDFTAPTYSLTTDGCKGVKLKANGTCTIDVKFEPKFEGTLVGNEWPLETPSGKMLANLELTGFGKNVVKISPGKLTWAPKEKHEQRFTLTTLSEIEITKLETNDPTDFSVSSVSGCKVKSKFNKSKVCEIVIERKTETKTGEKLFKWEYKDEDGIVRHGPEGVLEGQ